MLIGGQAEKARDMEGTLEIKAGREKRVYICLIARRESRLIFVLRDWLQIGAGYTHGEQ